MRARENLDVAAGLASFADPDVKAVQIKVGVVKTKELEASGFCRSGKTHLEGHEVKAVFFVGFAEEIIARSCTIHNGLFAAGKAEVAVAILLAGVDR